MPGCVSGPVLQPGCSLLLCWCRGQWGGTYTYNRLLSLDTGFYALLLDLDDQVLALEVARDSGNGDIYVANRLLPLVGEGILLGLLFGAGGCLFGGGGFWEDVSVVLDENGSATVFLKTVSRCTVWSSYRCLPFCEIYSRMFGFKYFQNRGKWSKLEKAVGGSHLPSVDLDGGATFRGSSSGACMQQRLQAPTHLDTSEHLQAYPCST